MDDKALKEGRSYGKHIVQYSPQYSFCAGCRSCEIVCSLVHDGLVSPTHSCISVKLDDTRHVDFVVYSCQQCEDHPCYDACPKQDQAMCIDENGIVYINEEECIGCGACAKHCAFEPSRINMARSEKRKDWKARKCDLCRTRPEGPACIEFCAVKCLGLSTDPQGAVVDPELPPEVAAGAFNFIPHKIDDDVINEHAEEIGKEVSDNA